MLPGWPGSAERPAALRLRADILRDDGAVRCRRRESVHSDLKGPLASRPATTDGADRRIAIVGLGYVGLPLAIAFVAAGPTVQGIDADAPRCAALAGGFSPV